MEILVLIFCSEHLPKERPPPVETAPLLRIEGWWNRLPTLAWAAAVLWQCPSASRVWKNEHRGPKLASENGFSQLFGRLFVTFFYGEKMCFEVKEYWVVSPTLLEFVWLFFSFFLCVLFFLVEIGMSQFFSPMSRPSIQRWGCVLTKFCVLVKAKSLEDASDDATKAWKLSSCGLSRIMLFPPKKTGHFLWPFTTVGSLGLMEFGGWLMVEKVFALIFVFL